MATTPNTQLYNAPYVRQITGGATPADADTTDTVTPVSVAPFAGIVTGVTYSPASAMTGATTNNRTIALYNETQTVTIATLTLASAVDIAAGAAGALTLSATAANLQVNAGDMLSFTSTHAGTGIADPGGMVAVTLSGVDSYVANDPYFENPAIEPTGADALHLGSLSI